MNWTWKSDNDGGSDATSENGYLVACVHPPTPDGRYVWLCYADEDDVHPLDTGVAASLIAGQSAAEAAWRKATGNDSRWDFNNSYMVGDQWWGKVLRVEIARIVDEIKRLQADFSASSAAIANLKTDYAKEAESRVNYQKAAERLTGDLRDAKSRGDNLLAELQQVADLVGVKDVANVEAGRLARVIGDHLRDRERWVAAADAIYTIIEKTGASPENLVEAVRESLGEKCVPPRWRDHYRGLAREERKRAREIVHAYEAYLEDLRTKGVFGSAFSVSAVAKLIRPFLDGTIAEDGTIAGGEDLDTSHEKTVAPHDGPESEARLAEARDWPDEVFVHRPSLQVKTKPSQQTCIGVGGTDEIMRARGYEVCQRKASPYGVYWYRKKAAGTPESGDLSKVLHETAVALGMNGYNIFDSAQVVRAAKWTRDSLSTWEAFGQKVLKVIGENIAGCEDPNYILRLVEKAFVPARWRGAPHADRAFTYRVIAAADAIIGCVPNSESIRKYEAIVKPFRDSVNEDGSLRSGGLPDEPEYPYETIIDTKHGPLSIWHDGEQKAGKPVDRANFGPHDYGDKNMGRCRHGCNCWMGNFNSGGPFNPMGPCPKNPRK